jgi:ABC-type transport system involved in multi-copper enzyme maturation permease subunit
MLLGIAIRAAVSLGGERDRQTFDSLMTTPLSNTEILFAKWLGSIVGLRKVFWLLVIVWIMGLATGGLSLLAVPVLVLAIGVYAAFFASLGLAIAASSKTTLRSIVWTMFATIFAGGGHAFCFFLVYVPLGVGRSGAGNDWPLKIEAGLITPFVLAMAAFCRLDFYQMWGPPRKEMVETAAVCTLGLLVFGSLAAVLWGSALDSFKRKCGRIFERPISPPRLHPRAPNSNRLTPSSGYTE